MRTNAEKKEINILLMVQNIYYKCVYADYYIVAAKQSPELGNKGISSFLMDTGLGISANKLDKLGWSIRRLK
jgi:hypothetical protein